MAIAYPVIEAGRERETAREDSASLTRRMEGLDALRALAMMLGVVFHSALAYITLRPDGLLWPVACTTSSPLCDYLICWIHSFRLPIFFILSGFFAELVFQKRGPVAFFQQRQSRLLYPYLLALGTIGPFTVAMALWGWVASGYVTWEQLLDRTSPLPPQLSNQQIGPGHLWFLQDLILLTLIYWLLRRDFLPQVRPQPTSAVADDPPGFWQRISLPALAALPTFLILWSQIDIVTTVNNSFIPDPKRLFYYGSFFVWGLCIFQHRDWFACVTSRPAQSLAIALICSVPLISCTILHAHSPDALNLAGTALFTALVAWYSIFGWFGFFLHHWTWRSPIVRYLSDSAYWVYLIHLPVVIAVQDLLLPLAWPALLKFAVCCVTTTLISLASYQLHVRHTWIGRMLHGPR